MGWYDRKVRQVRDLSCGDTRIFLELEVRRVDCRGCGKVKRERLDFLARHQPDTQTFVLRIMIFDARVTQAPERGASRRSDI
jgi:transposase